MERIAATVRRSATSIQIREKGDQIHDEAFERLRSDGRKIPEAVAQLSLVEAPRPLTRDIRLEWYAHRLHAAGSSTQYSRTPLRS